MKIKRILPLILTVVGIFVTTVGVSGAEAGIEFTGWVKDDKGLLLALKSKAGGYSSWVTIGRDFDGYTVRAMDEVAETLEVTKDGVTFRLPLVRSKVKLADTEPPPELKKLILNNLRQLAAAADQFFLENGVSRATYDDLVGPTKYVKKIVPQDGEDYQNLQFVQGKPFQVTTSQGYVISYRP